MFLSSTHDEYQRKERKRHWQILEACIKLQSHAYSPLQDDCKVRVKVLRMVKNPGMINFSWEAFIMQTRLDESISCHLIFNMNNFIRRKKEHSMIIIELKVVKFPDFRRWFLRIYWLFLQSREFLFII